MTMEEAIYQIKQLAVLSTDKEIPKITEALDMAIEALQREDRLLKSLETNEPIYDMVDVVRCKDCRWYDNRYGDVCHNPRYGDGYANYPPPYCDEDYWCKDGERKGGDPE